jgi:hypothetical protein
MTKLFYTFVFNQNILVNHLASTGFKKLLKKMVVILNIEVQNIVKQNYQKHIIEIDNFEMQEVCSYTTSKEPIIFVHHLIKKFYKDYSRFSINKLLDKYNQIFKYFRCIFPPKFCRNSSQYAINLTTEPTTTTTLKV